MSPLYQRLTSTFHRYLSVVTTEALVRRALLDAGVSPNDLTEQHLTVLAPHLERGIRLFVNLERQDQLRKELVQLGTGSPETLPAPQNIPIRVEQDISEARMVARGLCVALSARSLVVQKAATIVSELARNIVSYTPGGSLALTIVDGTPRRMRICAMDSGKGIGDLEAILAGRYRSRTGLGKGILGVQRLADSFNVQTGPAGTRIEVELAL
jgi:serine/threonine-protein kinase RsbT